VRPYRGLYRSENVGQSISIENVVWGGDVETLGGWAVEGVTIAPVDCWG